MSSCGIIISVVLLGLVASVHSYVATEYSDCYTTCNPSYLDSVARVVFGEARGDIYEGQVAVAYTIVNRVAHDGYADSISGVLDGTYVDSSHNIHHDYNTLDDPRHDEAWGAAKDDANTEYTTAIKASRAALCGCESDPTGCATDFCAKERCSALLSNSWYEAVNKMKVGAHYFVCRVPW